MANERAQRPQPMIGEDHITVTGLEIETIVGVYPAERKTVQTIAIDLKLFYPFGPSGLNDDFQKAVDYDQLTERLSAYVQEKRFELLETLSISCCDYLLDNYPLSAVALTVHKPSALRRASCVSATFYKKRNPN
ncbi:MAG: dihydroneopterin aldolase, partial [Pseudomonadales bacterium]|nr:dihydroneopterin aldolase [Pseudomonadales bacterium]